MINQSKSRYSTVRQSGLKKQTYSNYHLNSGITQKKSTNLQKHYLYPNLNANPNELMINNSIENPLNKPYVDQTKSPFQIFQQAKKKLVNEAQKVLRQKYIKYKDKRMDFQYFLHGQMPQNGYRLVIGLHGGGGVSSSQNDRQWINHQHLYDGQLPDGTIWFVPRSVEDVPDMWWKDYILQLLQKIIQYFSVLGLIHTNKVFLTGYSAGGDGVYHLAGMMADLLAGAAMMAGHPNNAICQNLRNIVFSIQVGQDDNAYDRANWAKLYINKLKHLRKQYGGFIQYSQIHQNISHWMANQDTSIFSSFFNQLRNPYPDFILFKNNPKMRRKKFYNLQFEDYPQGLVCVYRKENNIIIDTQSKRPIKIKILVHSKMIDIQKEIKIQYNGYTTQTRVDLSERYKVMQRTANDYLDPQFMFEAQIICYPQTNLSKDLTLLRPSDLHLTGSSQKIIKALQNIACSENKIYSTSKTLVVDYPNLIKQIEHTKKIYLDQQQFFEDSIERYLQKNCRDCQIY